MTAICATSYAFYDISKETFKEAMLIRLKLQLSYFISPLLAYIFSTSFYSVKICYSISLFFFF